MASPRSSFDSPSSSEEEDEEEEEDEPISTTFSGPRIVRPVTLENDQFVQVLNREKDKVLEQRRRQQQQLDESKRSRDRSAEQDSGTDHSRTESGNSDASFASMTAVGPSPAEEATLPPAFGGGSVGMERDDTLRPSSSSTGNRWDQGPTGGTVKSIDEIINGYKALGVVVGGNEVKGIVERRRSSVATIQLQQQQQRRPSDSMSPAPKPASRDVSLDEYQFPTFHAPNGSAEPHAQNLLPYVPFPTPPPSASLSVSTAGLDGPAGGKIKTIEEIIAQHAGATYDPIRKKNVATVSSPITATFGDPISQHVQRTRELSNISSADSQDSLNREVRESIHSTLLEDRRRRRETSVASSVNGGFDDRRSVPGGGTTSSMKPISLKNYRGANSPSPSPRSISPNPQSVNIPSPTSTGHEIQEQLELSLLLRSPRLTRLVKLSRPHNAHLTVSIADVGSPSGHPVVVFLGLGSVRYMLALYDELAEVFGLRLICVDRWGVGKTTNEPDITKRGFREWSRVVEEVVEDHLGLPRGRFSILAHSAGCPFAVETALATRVTGAIHLLAPWVVSVAGASADELGGGVSADSLAGMYKYLKYVPSGVLKTAQAAEWKIQGWRLGKAPPSVVVERDDDMFNVAETAEDHEDDYDSRKDASVDGSVLSKAAKRESLASLGIVGSGDVVDKLERMYPDGGIRLAGPHATSSTRSAHAAASTPRRKGSLSVNGKSLLGSILGGSAKSNRSYSGDASPSSVRSTGRRSSYFAASAIHDSPASSARERSSGLTAPATPTSASSKRTSYLSDRSFPPRSPTDSHSSLDHPSSPSASSIPPRGSHLTATPTRASISPAVLISGLLRASHAESLPGSTLDLLVLLDRSSNSAAKTIDYRAVERPVRVWFGDKDDRISENSVRSLEREMKQCRVEVVPGADHNLMTSERDPLPLMKVRVISDCLPSRTDHQVMFRVLESISKEAALP